MPLHEGKGALEFAVPHPSDIKIVVRFSGGEKNLQPDTLYSNTKDIYLQIGSESETKDQTLCSPRGKLPSWLYPLSPDHVCRRRNFYNSFPIHTNMYVNTSIMRRMCVIINYLSMRGG